MKTLLSIAFISMTIVTGIYSQTNDTIKRTRYGIEISQFITGSGFASGTEVYITVIPNNKKNISLGLYFCPEAKRLTGVTLHHEISLLRNSNHKKVFPYAFYNMIYRITRTRVELAENNYEMDYVRYKSFEHHIGIGVQIAMAKDISFKSALGYGVYLGSIKKPSAPDPITGEIMGQHGFGAIAKIGIAYTF